MLQFSTYCATVRGAETWAVSTLMSFAVFTSCMGAALVYVVNISSYVFYSTYKLLLSYPLNTNTVTFQRMQLGLEQFFCCSHSSDIVT